MQRSWRCISVLLPLIASACGPTPATPTEMAKPTSSPRPSATLKASVTPAPVRATASPGPAPRFFTEDFEATPTAWGFVLADREPDALEAKTENGFLRMRLATANLWAYALYGAQTYEDVRVDAQVELDASGQGAGGVICRYDAALGWYEFNIYADRTYALLFGQWLAPDVARYTPLMMGESEAITAPANAIGLACQGNVLTPYINGVQIRKRQENIHILTEGEIGVAASTFGAAPLVIAYDWVTVGEP